MIFLPGAPSLLNLQTVLAVSPSLWCMCVEDTKLGGQLCSEVAAHHGFVPTSSVLAQSRHLAAVLSPPVINTPSLSAALPMAPLVALEHARTGAIFELWDDRGDNG